MSFQAGPQPVGQAEATLSQPNQHGQFIPLSRLSSTAFSVRELLPLVPAALVSLVLNAGFVIGLMIIYDFSPAHGHGPGKAFLLPEDGITVENQPPDDFIVADPDDLLGTGVTTPSDPRLPGADPEDLPPGLNIKPDANALPGAGPGADSGIVGKNDAGNPAPPGSMLADAEIGAQGESGSLIIGKGFGNPDGNQRGSQRDGGDWGARTKKTMGSIRAAGGNDASQQAVGKALVWLAAHQSPDGRWSLNNYHKHNPACKCKDMNFEASVGENDTAGTALGLLPFLAAGHTHKKGTHEHAGTVLKGLAFLCNRQQNNGDLGGGMYAHGLATIALCEAYGMTSDVKLRSPAQKAISFIEYAQNPQTGGWRYQPRTDGDTSVVAWQVMALHSGQMAGLTVKSQTIELAKRWLNSCQSDGGAKYAYVPGEESKPSMTAAALLNRQYLGWGPRNPELHRGCEHLLKTAPPPPEKPAANEQLGPIYYYYYASQVMHHMGDKYWETWNPRMRDFLIRTQLKKDDGHREGSWDPRGSDHGGVGGRIYTTSLACLTLEVYYRHLPLYRREPAAKEVEVKKEPGPQ